MSGIGATGAWNGFKGLQMVISLELVVEKPRQTAEGADGKRR